MLTYLGELVLAVFFVWETLVFLADRTQPSRAVFSRTVALHPLAVLGGCWWATDGFLSGAAVSAVVLILHVLFGRLSGSSAPTEVRIPRRRGGGLPPFP